MLQVDSFERFSSSFSFNFNINIYFDINFIFNFDFNFNFDVNFNFDFNFTLISSSIAVMLQEIKMYMFQIAFKLCYVKR